MKVAVYARVSSEDQQERGTIENQLEFARKYCELHQSEVAAWYKDDGVTGTIPLEDRPDGVKVLADAKAKKYELLLIYRLDRLGRSARTILNAVHELESAGVKIRSMKEPFDTGDPSGRFLLTILAGVADLERETILERMWYGANRAARSGKWLGGIVPYGYMVNAEGFLEVSEEPLPGLDMSEADVVRLIYRLIAEQRYSTIRVADYLNSLGVPPSYKKDGRKVKRGKRKENTAGVWNPGRIRNMIVNTTYKGIHQYGKRTKKQREIITREVPAIITEEQWAKAQQILKDNRIEADRNARRKYLLRGLIKCGICGLTYIGAAHPSYVRKDGVRKLKAYYVCNGKHAYRGPLSGKCTAKNLPRDWVEEMIWNQCVEFIQNPGDAIKELAASIEQTQSLRSNYEEEREVIQKGIREKEHEKQRILDLYRREVISDLDVEEQIMKIRHETDHLKVQLKSLNEQIEAEKGLERDFNTAEELLSNLKAKLDNNPTFEDKRDIVKTLVKEIIVYTKNNDRGKPEAKVSARFRFDAADVTRTDVRENNNYGIFIVRVANLRGRRPFF
jgi:site-specific DNA recombinase